MIIKEITKKIFYFDNQEEREDYISIMGKRGYKILSYGFDSKGWFFICKKED